MMPFMTQPAVAPACYVPKGGIAQSQIFGKGRYLTRTPTVTGSLKTLTISGWIARSALGGESFLLSARSSVSNQSGLVFSGDTLVQYQRIGGTDKGASASGLLRNPGPFVHVHAVLNTPASAAAERAYLTVSGVTRAGVYTAPGPNEDGWINSSVEHRIGMEASIGGSGFDGLMADLMLIDGAVIPPSAFGEFNIHGVWVPRPTSEIHAAIAAAGGWGVNGFHLDFSDPLNPGKDVSGKGNHWTAVGFDATGKDTVASTPTNVYATWSPLTGSPSATLPYTVNLSDGALVLEGNGIYYGYVYAEATMRLPTGRDTYLEVELLSATDSAAEVGVGGLNISLVGSPHLAWAVGDTVGVLVTDTAIYARRQGVWVVGNPISGVGGVPRTGNVIWASDSNGIAGSTCRIRANFGQRAWRDAPPAGAGGLCTDNLPEPDIKDPGEAFVQVATTGGGIGSALKTMTGHWNGAPYVEIIKRRDASEDWRVRFSDDPDNAWATNNALAKAAAPALVAAGNYVGYRLRVGARYGVWTAEVEHVTGTVTTVTHGLNTTRAAVICTRVSAGGGDRYYRHPDLSAGSLLKLNSNSLAAPDGTLTSFGADSFQIAAGAPSGTYRVLVMAARAGYLCLGAYAATGVAGDGGPFLAMDIAPLLLIQRRHNAAASYEVLDVVREPANPTFKELLLNAPNAENTNSNQFDFVVGGVKCRTDPANSDSADSNASGGQHVFIAIGRPVGGVCVAPATAR